jgi:hypothetical protein
MPRLKKDAPKLGRQRAAPAANAFAYTVEDGMAMGLPGKSTIYKMIADGRLETVKVGGRTTMVGGRPTTTGGRTMLVGDSVRRMLGVKKDVA